MEPNKNIENHFKDQLNMREIQPTHMSWDRLDAMLTIAEHKEPKKKINWFLIAASIVSIFFTTILIFQLNTNEDKLNNQIVINDTTKINTKALIINPLNNSSKPTTFNQKLTINNQQPLAYKIIINQKSEINSIKNKNQKALTSQNSKQINQNQNPNEVSTLKISVNPEILLALVESSNANQTKVPQAIFVNTSSLLSQVNGELSQEFRETKLQKLKRNYQNVKVAMESRNDKQ